MEFAKKTVVLKNGQEALLRSPLPGEGAQFLEFFVGLCTETEYVANYPEELKLSVEDEEKWIQNTLTDPNRVNIACFIDGKLAGNCGVHRSNKLKMKHRAILDIGIRKAFWNMGLGTLLLKELIAVAKSWDVEQIELEVDSQNSRARHVYEKLGFRTVAAVPRALKHKGDSYSDLITMIYEGE